MEQFFFKKPILRKSTEKIPVYNSEGVIVCYIQRYFENWIQRTIDMVLDELFIHVKVFNDNNEVMINGKEILSIKNLVFSKWELKDNDGNLISLKDKTKIKTNPRLEFKYKDNEFKLEKDFGDKTTRIRDNRNNIICEIVYDKPIPPSNITISHRDLKSIDVFLIVCVYYIFTLRE